MLMLSDATVLTVNVAQHLEPVMTADLDTLLTALYVELTDRIIPLRGPGPPRAGKAAGRHRRRARLPGRCAGPAPVRRRAALAARRPAPGRAPVPAAAGPERVQHQAAADRAADGGRPALARRRHPGHRGAVAADGRHPGPVRHLRRHREAL